MCFLLSSGTSLLAQFKLGIMFAVAVQAVDWYKKDADQGHVYVQCSMGVIYTNGADVTKDFVKAENWYKKDAEQGHVHVQYSLGVVYMNGTDVKRTS